MDASIEGFVKALGGGVGAVGGTQNQFHFFPLKWTEIKTYVFFILDTNLQFVLNCNMELANKISLESFTCVPKSSPQKNVSAELFSTTLLYPLEVTKTKAPWLISGRQASPNLGKGTEYSIPLTYLIYLIIICILQYYIHLYLHTIVIYGLDIYHTSHVWHLNWILLSFNHLQVLH